MGKQLILSNFFKVSKFPKNFSKILLEYRPKNIQNFSITAQFFNIFFAFIAE